MPKKGTANESNGNQYVCNKNLHLSSNDFDKNEKERKIVDLCLNGLKNGVYIDVTFYFQMVIIH